MYIYIYYMCIQSHNTVVLMTKLQKSCGEYIYKNKREHSISMSNIKNVSKKAIWKMYKKDAGFIICEYYVHRKRTDSFQMHAVKWEIKNTSRNICIWKIKRSINQKGDKFKTHSNVEQNAEIEPNDHWLDW